MLDLEFDKTGESVVLAATVIAKRSGTGVMGVEDLAIALFREPSASLLKCLGQLGISPKQCEDYLSQTREFASGAYPSVNRETIAIFRQARSVAQNRGAKISSLDLLGSILTSRTRAAKALAELGLNYRRFQKEYEWMLSSKIAPQDPLTTDLPPEADLDICLIPLSDSQDVGFKVLIDPGDASVEEIIEVYEAFSTLQRALGGNGLIFLDCPDETPALAGVLV